jgi:hypothetical protein
VAVIAAGHCEAVHEFVKAILGPGDPGRVRRLELVIDVNDVVRVAVWRYPDVEQLQAAAGPAAALRERAAVVVEEKAARPFGPEHVVQPRPLGGA